MPTNFADTIKRTLNMRQEMSFSFYFIDFIFRKLMRYNARVDWAVHHTATIHNPKNITRGKGVYPGDSPGVYINALNGFTIGDYSNIGPNVGIISANHDVVDNEHHQQAVPIIIGRFCWLGMGCLILPGVTLGDFTIVGAGAVVTKSFPEGYCVLAGNPASVIRLQNKEVCDAFANRKK
jgi:acetyltransferase-like isoleucine patch superfamily enzyme